MPRKITQPESTRPALNLVSTAPNRLHAQRCEGSAVLHAGHSPTLWRAPFCILVPSAMAETGLQEMSTERGSLRHRNSKSQTCK